MKQIAGKDQHGATKTPASPQATRRPLRPSARAPASRSAIVIAGMHRSGTSALARVLSLLGAALPKHLMPAGRFNEAGHWESTVVMELHNAVFASIGLAWHDWREIETGWFESEAAKAFQSQLAEVLREEYDGASLFVVKDPRICRLLPLWLQVLRDIGIAPHLIIPVRNPIEVTESLLRRNEIFPALPQPYAAQAGLLWLRSVLDAEFASRSFPRAVITYDALLEDWQGTVATIAARARLTWPRDLAIAAPEIDRFLSRELRHHAVGHDQFDQRPDIRAWVRGAYTALLELAREGDDKRRLTELDAVRLAFDESCRTFAPLVQPAESRFTHELQVMATASREISGDIENLKMALGMARLEMTQIGQLRNGEAQTLLELKTAADRAQQHEQQLSTELETLGVKLQSSAQLLNSYANALETARSEIEALEGQLKESRQDRGRAAAHIDQLSAEIAGLKEKDLAAAQALLRALQSELAAEKARGQAVLREAGGSAQKLRDSEAKLRLAEERLEQHGTQLSHLRRKSDDDRVLSEALREQLAAALAERAALDQRATSLDSELKASTVRLDGQVTALDEAEKTLAQSNAQLALLMLRDTIARDLAAAAKAVRRRAGQTPLGLSFQNAQLRSSFALPSQTRRKRRAEWRDVAASGLFDSDWYLARNPDVAAAGIAPFAHFMTHGIVEDRDPHPLFSSGWYRIQMYRHNTEANLPPLLHYLSSGRAQRLSPHPLFDPRYYLETYQDVAATGFDPLRHFLTYGAAEWRNPHPLVWMQRLAEQPGFAKGSANVLIDYLKDPQLFSASPHPLFNAAAYLADNPDVARAGVNPLLHYCAVGWRQGRAAHRVFAGDWYLAHHSDVLDADVDPLAHYLRHGAQEYRDPHPLFDIKFYYARYRDTRRLPYDALSDYVLNGLGDPPRETTAKVSVANIRALVAPEAADGMAPIVAFLDARTIAAYVPSSGRVFEIRPSGSWPPSPTSVYWLPQRLRDYIIERHGEEVIALYVYLMSVVERYGARQNGFAQTSDFAVLCNRLRTLAATRLTRDAAEDPAADGVDVSIVVPVYNNLVYTLTSVISLLEHNSRHSYEVLIGDDSSTDATAKVFAAAGGCVRLVHHDKNLGFLRNCNHTAGFAKGRIIAFLNNDTLLLPGWVDEMADALDKTPNAGLVGAKLINADGSLQEAGGILWRDGSGWNFGRNADPRLPAFNYLKDIDYVSGAALALSAKLWRQLGGFDMEFAPAYCEDSDLAFRVREAGLRTLYAPHAELIHHEGKSHGRDTGSGIKAYQVENQNKLYARWKSALADNHPNGRNVFVARDRSTDKPHILFVDHYVPQWDRDAGSRTMFHFLRLFVAQGFQVSFWPDNLHEDRTYCGPLQRMGIEIIYGRDHVGGFEKFIDEAGPHLDYVLLSRPDIAIKYYDAIRAHSGARLLYYGHDVHWKRTEQAHAVAATPADDAAQGVEAMRRLETENWRKADAVLYPSIEERDLVRGVVRQAAAVQVPMLGYLPEELAVARRNLARFDARRADDLLFVGGSHPPNVDALLWFAHDVLPLVLAQNPRARLNIVGSTMVAAVERLDSENIRVLGRVSDQELAAHYAAMGLAVVPLRYGAGVKGKTLEAFINGIPLVATPVGMQGIATDGPLAFIAEDAKGLAEAVLRAQRDTAAAMTQAEAAARYMEEAYSIKALQSAFAAVITEFAADQRAPAPRKRARGA